MMWRICFRASEMCDWVGEAGYGKGVSDLESWAEAWGGGWK